MFFRVHLKVLKALQRASSSSFKVKQTPESEHITDTRPAGYEILIVYLISFVFNLLFIISYKSNPLYEVISSHLISVVKVSYNDNHLTKAFFFNSNFECVLEQALFQGKLRKKWLFPKTSYRSEILRAIFQPKVFKWVII